MTSVIIVWSWIKRLGFWLGLELREKCFEWVLRGLDIKMVVRVNGVCVKECKEKEVYEFVRWLRSGWDYSWRRGQSEQES